MSKKMFFVFWVFVLFQGANAQTWSPEKIVSRAIRHSLQVHSNANQVAAREGALRQAKAVPNPEIGGIASNRSQMLALGQQIEYPGKRRVRVRRAEAELEAAKWRQAQAEHEIAAEVMDILYQILAADRKVGLFQQNVAVSQQLLSAAQEKFNQGFASRLDVIKGQVEVARARRLLLKAQKEKVGRRSDLKLTLGLSPADTLYLADVLDAALLPGSVKLDSLQQFAQHHPRLQVQRYLVQASQLDVQAARLATRPDFNFDLAGGIDDDESRVELELRLPLALWDRKAGLKAKTHFLNRSAQNDSAAVWLEISREVTAAFYNYQNVQRIMRLFRPSLLNEAKAAAALAQQTFQTGQYRFLDLIDARRTYLETAQELIEAQAGLRIAEVELLKATGTHFQGEKQ